MSEVELWISNWRTAITSTTSSTCSEFDRRESYASSNVTDPVSSPKASPSSFSGESDQTSNLETFRSQDSDQAIFPVQDTVSPEQAQVPLREPVPAKRGRGRPRKHEPKPPKPADWSPKFRSRTGCYTCRRRKKKCDEIGFPCKSSAWRRLTSQGLPILISMLLTALGLNCRRVANTICEGYPSIEKQSTRSASTASRVAMQLLPKEVPISALTSAPKQDSIGFESGVVNATDIWLLENFKCHLSNLICIGQKENNLYNKTLLPLAMNHSGIRHSIMYLSALQLYECEKSTKLLTLREFHHEQAFKSILNVQNHSHVDIKDATRVQALILCIASTYQSDKAGQRQYSIHLDYIGNSLFGFLSRNEILSRLLTDFWLYSSTCNAITSLHRRVEPNNATQASLQDTTRTIAFLGIRTFLLVYLARVTSLRDRIRRCHNFTFSTEKELVGEIKALENDLETHNLQNVARDLEHEPYLTINHLYRECVYIYLYRTCSFSAPHPQLFGRVANALTYIERLKAYSAEAALLMPLFLVCCAAFNPLHRPALRSALKRVQTCRESKNVEYAARTIECIWQSMDEKEQDSWDWETMMNDNGWDFLLA